MQRIVSVATALAIAGLALGQIGFAAPSAAQSYLGTPATPGTRTPEQSPATSVSIPQISAPSATSPAGPPASAVPGNGAASSPGLSFGAAPAPITSPGR
jgi:hypothetical protein